MMLRRLMLAIMSLGIVLGTAGCSEKATPTPMEASVQKDREMAESILGKLKKDVALSDDSRTFQVLTVNGETTIYGTVDSELERTHAEQIVMDSEGVTGVTSRLRLSNQPVETASTATPQ